MKDFLLEYLLSYRAFYVYGILMIEIPLYFHCRRRSYFALKAALGVVLFVATGLFFPFPIDTALIVSTIVFCLSVLLFWALYELPFRSALFLCVLAYLLQNMAININKIIMALFGLTYEQSPPIHLLCLLAFSAIGFFVLIRRWNIDRLVENVEGSKHLILLGAITSLCIVIILNTLFQENGLDYEVFSLAAVVVSCFFALCLQYAELKDGQLEIENKIIQQLLSAERTQYSISKESIDIINMKCHDLKHQIAAIRTHIHQDQQQALQEIEEAASFYDAVAKTGNEVLDAVLTEKILYCEKHGILMTYMVDQKELLFINDMDLYALLGNALDNAIEGVMKEDRDKRLITLTICRKNEMLIIHVENYCKAPPSFQDGLPQTTKEDKQNHGFGVKSIRYLAERYHGYASFQTAHEMFLLDVVIPVPV